MLESRCTVRMMEVWDLNALVPTGIFEIRFLFFERGPHFVVVVG